MDSITQNRRYLPHEFQTKVHAVKLYRKTRDVKYICRLYHCSKASLMRWNKQYDGNDESLRERSHRPLSKHPTAHSEQEEKWIMNYCRRTPGITMGELYSKMVRKHRYNRHPGSLRRVCIRLGLIKKVESTKKKSKHLGRYETPTMPGEKWQMDVKYVPAACYSGENGERYYQYTMIDEATRERFLYAAKEQNGYETKKFVERAIRYFKYKPQIIQTDNGTEFTNVVKTNRKHIFDVLCEELGITHKLIRPRTPWHNGKVERSHRNDQERFYNHMKYYSFEDLQAQLKRYMYRSNSIPMAVLGYRTPKEMRQLLVIK